MQETYYNEDEKKKTTEKGETKKKQRLTKENRAEKQDFSLWLFTRVQIPWLHFKMIILQMIFSLPIHFFFLLFSFSFIFYVFQCNATIVLIFDIANKQQDEKEKKNCSQHSPKFCT